MNRLTERDEYGNADIIGVYSSDLQLNLEFDEFIRVTESLNRLAAYEDTGREPNEIAALDHDVAMLKQSARHANQLAVEVAKLRKVVAVANDIEINLANMSYEKIGTLRFNQLLKQTLGFNKSLSRALEELEVQS